MADNRMQSYIHLKVKFSAAYRNELIELHYCAEQSPLLGSKKAICGLHFLFKHASMLYFMLFLGAQIQQEKVLIIRMMQQECSHFLVQRVIPENWKYRCIS